MPNIKPMDYSNHERFILTHHFRVLATLAILVGFCLISTIQPAQARRKSHGSGPVYVRAHTTKNGHYVEGYFRNSPNHTTSDNYGHAGNYNPTSGKIGMRNEPDRPKHRRRSSSSDGSNETWVNGYTRRDGTPVAGHYRRKTR